MINKWNKLNLKLKVLITTFFIETTLASLIILITYFVIARLYKTNLEGKSIRNSVFLINMIKEADIILLPIIIIIVIIFSFLGSYLFFELVTKPLITIIDQEHFQMSRKKAFIAAISHELKTPITVISGQLEGMIHNIGKYKDRELYLKKCYDTTQDMKFLISKMMEISRKDIFDEKSEKIEIDINGLVQNSINKHRFVYEQKNIRIITNYRNRQKIVANEEDMKTVINNIIGNAIFYSPENNTIIVTLNEKMISLSEYLVTLTVENTGVSLSKEQLKSIFEPLYRVETSRNRNTGGSGLGLYFVSQILTNHGFKYKMFSRENSTVFTIDFTPYDINYIS